MKIIIAGAHGFIGSTLIPFLRKRGHEVIVLTRTPHSEEPFWDPAHGQLDPMHFEGSDAVINLSGESILGRWNQEKMERIRESRFKATNLLTNTLLNLQNPPKIYIGASAIGYYGDRGEERLTEGSQSGHGYLAEVTRLWEGIPQKLESKDVRVVALRLGIVLGQGGGALAKMLPSFKLGCAGVIGDGDQMMSWVSIQDVCNAVHFILEGEIAGPINCVAPTAVTNRAFTKMLGEVLHRPTLLPLPKFLLKLFFGSGADLFLASTNVVPEKLERAGFQFEYPDLKSALAAQLDCVSV